MDQEPDVIRQDIEQTRSSLTDKIETLECEVKETVQTAKETVEETFQTAKETVQGTIDSVKETVQDTVESVKRTFDLSYQVDRHPWGMVGASAVAGCLTAYFLSSRRPHRSFHHLAQVPAPTTNGAVTPETAPLSLSDMASTARPEKPSLLTRLLRRFDPEIDQVKEMAIGAAVGLVRDWAKESMPSLAPKIEEVMDSATTKLGGDPIRGPVLEGCGTSTSRPARSVV